MPEGVHAQARGAMTVRVHKQAVFYHRMAIWGSVCHLSAHYSVDNNLLTKSVIYYHKIRCLSHSVSLRGCFIVALFDVYDAKLL